MYNMCRGEENQFFLGRLDINFIERMRDSMVTTESVTIRVPVGMSKYLKPMNSETELIRNALLLYPYILNQTMSHGGAAEILGIRKSELIDIYDKLGYSYLDMTMDELDSELETFRQLKNKESAE